MTDEPATTPADPRVTALTLRIGDLREQRDEARREAVAARTAYDDLAAKVRWSEVFAVGDLQRERDEARAQVRQLTASQTEADDLRAAILRLADKWEADRLNTGIDKEAAAYLLRDLLEDHAERIRIARVRDSSASVDPIGAEQ